MKKQDLIFILGVTVLLLPFFICKPVSEWYYAFNASHGMIMSFLKFAVLSTLGEMIGLRISSGVYNRRGFGILPRMLVWGVLGMGINIAMIIFSNGTPVVLQYLGMQDAVQVMHETLSWKKAGVAFAVSVSMNTLFAPVFMTLHKVTDIHILTQGGTLRGFFTPIHIREILINLNWGVLWGFVFKKTIPLFWYPAHTITFLLPGNMRVLFAALLGVVLGVLLAVGARMGEKNTGS
ncbi:MULTISPECIES: hypothetical protein [Culturomica]|uniref:hypothetical protein n=1 Tax=Culturomica TaxID=1926651 RepID=UPI00083918FE|nr:MULTISPECIES: hypothetical protein [Odoribacteraceae]RHV96473.1 hypothetical protein DXA95_05385 [Odoribacter sp. OF09-27XD]HBO26777.1 hypothetical protein [Culturomica sp.]